MERETDGLFSVARRVARSRRYPKVDGEAGREVELRLMAVLFSEALPAPRDVLLIALANARGIFGRLLSPGEMAEVRECEIAVREWGYEPPNTDDRPPSALQRQTDQAQKAQGGVVGQVQQEGRKEGAGQSPCQRQRQADQQDQAYGHPASPELGDVQ